MKILEINSWVNGSTGKIMLMIADNAREKGYEAITVSPKNRVNMMAKAPTQWLFGNRWVRYVSSTLAYWTGYIGCFSIGDTWLLLRRIRKYNPDIIHLHNLHPQYINLPMLFGYLKTSPAKVIWTLHDCWSFTGSCAHFSKVKCSKWKEGGCEKCTIYREYPWSRFDNAGKMFKLKKKWFTGVKDMTIVTPSHWLADCVKESFLKEYNVQVIHNGIDIDIFKPRESNFLDKYNLRDKKIVLGVAFGWGVTKGLGDFIKLSQMLPEEYQIVLVGTNDNVDKELPTNIISIHHTESQLELAEIYAASAVFVNPTIEDNYPTTNLEALSCGTPVITYRTGGSPEAVSEETGAVVEQGDIDGLISAIRKFTDGDYSQVCRQRAEQFVDSNIAYASYLKLYKSLVGGVK